MQKRTSNNSSRQIKVPVEFPTIQQAIESSDEGDIIEVSHGAYFENLVLNKAITIICENPGVEIYPKEIDCPIIAIENFGSDEIKIAGISFVGDIRVISNRKIGIFINSGNVSIQECRFTGWDLIPDGSLPDDDDFWEAMRVGAVFAHGEKTTLNIERCDFEDCSIGVSLENVGLSNILSSHFSDCNEVSISTDNSALTSKGNLMTECASAFWLISSARVDSSYDTFKGIGEFIGSGNAGGVFTCEDDTIFARTFLTLVMGRALTSRRPDGTWDIRTPRVVLKNCFVVLDSELPTYRYAPSYDSSWGIPNINVVDLIEKIGKTTFDSQANSQYVLKDKLKLDLDSRETTTKISQPSTTPFANAFATQIPEVDLDVGGDFGLALDIINAPDINCFITGKAGTGKSTLLRYFVEKTDRKLALLAPTGIAAVNIHGETIHSFFRFPPRPITPDDIHISRDKDLYLSLDTIVIDEVSMVRADLMDAIDQFMRLNGKYPDRPFGGVQMFFFGDVFQLQPVVAGEEEGRYFASYYASQYFFDAKAFNSLQYEIINLGKVFRQKDQEFIQLLDAVRLGYIKDDQISALNKRYIPDYLPNNDSSHITLTSTNRLAAEMNEFRLHEIADREFTFMGRIEGEYPERSLPTEMSLKLKRGAQIMFVKNDAKRRWVNGTIGRIINIDENHVEAEVNQSNGERYIFPVGIEKWEILKHKYDYAAHTIKTEVVGTFSQYPIKLAWAVTIHKSQGLTFDNIVVDLGNGAFAHGQTYVALSRCTSLDGIILKRKVNQSDIIIDYPVRNYYESRVLRTAYR